MISANTPAHRFARPYSQLASAYDIALGIPNALEHAQPLKDSSGGTIYDFAPLLTSAAAQDSLLAT